MIWCWLIGSILNLSTALSIGEIISTYPTSGGLSVLPFLWYPAQLRLLILFLSAPAGTPLRHGLFLASTVPFVAGCADGLTTSAWSPARPARSSPLPA